MREPSPATAPVPERASARRVLLPGSLRDSARRFADSSAEPAVPRRAATVILLRPPAAGVADVAGGEGEAGAAKGAGAAGDASGVGAEGGFELFALRRASTMVFAPSMYAFPGGSVDPRDGEKEVGWAGPVPEWWAKRLGLEAAKARAVVCAAVREVFEECGVLLAGPDKSTVVGDVSGADWEAARVALLAREVALSDVLASRGLVVRSDLLAPWSRWLTPEFEPRRFDTFFFLARMPTEQRTRDVGGEADHTLWGQPGEIAKLPMLPPTAFTLRQLAAYDSPDAALAASEAHDLSRPWSPHVQFDGDEAWLVLD